MLPKYEIHIWMFDRSAGVIAVFNGESDGTMNTIDYTKRAGMETVVIVPRTLPAHG